MKATRIHKVLPVPVLGVLLGCATSGHATWFARVAGCVHVGDSPLLAGVTAAAVPGRESSAGDAGDQSTGEPDRPAPSQADGKDPLELPDITVKGRAARPVFSLARWVTACRGCPDCVVADVPGRRWKLTQMRIEEDGEIGVLPALILWTRKGKLALHWRRLR